MGIFGWLVIVDPSSGPNANLLLVLRWFSSQTRANCVSTLTVLRRLAVALVYNVHLLQKHTFTHRNNDKYDAAGLEYILLNVNLPGNK